MLRKGKNKKVVIWDNLKSSVVEQAIFILRENADYDDDYIVREAQSVINNFLSWQNRSESGPARKKKNKPGFFKRVLPWFSTFCVLTLLIYLLYRSI